MNYRNARLANGFLSLDQLAGEIDIVKSRVVSDNGAGAERMIGDIDRTPGDAEREERDAAAERLRKIHAAVVKLYRAGQGSLVSTLILICRNGKNRNESIREIATRRRISFESAKARYFSHREKIEKNLSRPMNTGVGGKSERRITPFSHYFAAHGDIEGRDCGEVHPN